MAFCNYDNSVVKLDCIYFPCGLDDDGCNYCGDYISECIDEYSLEEDL